MGALGLVVGRAGILLAGLVDFVSLRWESVAFGLAGVLVLVTVGPYPVSMVGVDTASVNNTYPPRVTLVFLGLFPAGVVLLLEGAAQRHGDLSPRWLPCAQGWAPSLSSASCPRRAPAERAAGAPAARSPGRRGAPPGANPLLPRGRDLGQAAVMRP
ncbi:MAG TPA: hypothetical protein VK964_06865 [Nocardioidaceae bacterium]|nr:hypothetical protein [Nocardioidaceae bacterium]